MFILGKLVVYNSQCSSAGARDGSLGGEVAEDLGSGSGLGSSLSLLGGGVLSSGGVVVLLGHGDGSSDVEGSGGNLGALGLVGASVAGLGHSGLVSHGLSVWDGDGLGTNVGVGSSGLRVEGGERSSSGWGTEGGLSSEVASESLVSEGDGRGESDEGDEGGEFHLVRI